MATSLNEGESLTISTTSTTSIVAKNKGHQFSKSSTCTKHQLTEEMMMDFCVFKTFKNINSGVVDNVRFMSDGGLAVTSASDDQINVFDTIRGSHLRTCHSKKYGCALATFTHSPSNILYASTKLDHDLRYLSLHDNKFLRFFSGHSDQVTNLCMSPVEDLFLTTANDKTLRLWDLRTRTSSGHLNMMDGSASGVCDFDPEGLLFGVGMSNSNAVKLYDIRAYSYGPFTSFKLPPGLDKLAKWNNITFSPDGGRICLNTNGPCFYVIDSFDGRVCFAVTDRTMPLPCTKGIQTKLDVCFSADGKYIMSTNGDGMLLIWDAVSENGNGRHVTTLSPYNPAVMNVLKFNPKMSMIFSAGKDTAFWLPRTFQEGEDEEL